MKFGKYNPKMKLLLLSSHCGKRHPWLFEINFPIPDAFSRPKETFFFIVLFLTDTTKSTLITNKALIQ